MASDDDRDGSSKIINKLLDDLVINSRAHSRIIHIRNAHDLCLVSRVYQRWGILDDDSRLRKTVMESYHFVNNSEAEMIEEQSRIISSVISMTSDKMRELKCDIDGLGARMDPAIEKSEPITIRVEFIDCSFVVVVVDKTDHVYEIKRRSGAVSLIKQDKMMTVLDDLMIISDVLVDGEVICGIRDPNCVTMGDILMRLNSLVECMIDLKGRLPAKK